MIVYVPKVIESEQEASELPEGTVIFFDLNGEIVAGAKVGIDAWRTSDYGYDALDYLDHEVVGWTSLRAVDVLDSLVSVVAERSEFHSVEDVKRRLKESE